MARTTSEILADAKAENYWSAVERRNAKRREQRAELRARPICCHCKRARAESKDSILCKADADEYRRLFGVEP